MFDFDDDEVSLRIERLHQGVLQLHEPSIIKIEQTNVEPMLDEHSINVGSLMHWLDVEEAFARRLPSLPVARDPSVFGVKAESTKDIRSRRLRSTQASLAQITSGQLEIAEVLQENPVLFLWWWLPRRLLPRWFILEALHQEGSGWMERLLPQLLRVANCKK